MVHCLAAIAAGVDHTAEALLCETFLLSYLSGHDHQFAHDCGVLVFEVGDALDVLTGDQQDVLGSRGVDVAEGIQVVVTIDPV